MGNASPVHSPVSRLAGTHSAGAPSRAVLSGWPLTVFLSGRKAPRPFPEGPAERHSRVGAAACRFAESCHFPGRCQCSKETSLQGVLAHLRVSHWALSRPSNLTLSATMAVSRTVPVSPGWLPARPEVLLSPRGCFRGQESLDIRGSGRTFPRPSGSGCQGPGVCVSRAQLGPSLGGPAPVFTFFVTVSLARSGPVRVEKGGVLLAQHTCAADTGRWGAWREPFLGVGCTWNC